MYHLPWLLTVDSWWSARGWMMWVTAGHSSISFKNGRFCQKNVKDNKKTRSGGK